MSSHIPRNIPLRHRIRAVVAGVVRRRLIAARERFLRTAHDQCRETQQATLDGLLALNGDSRFSQQHGLTPGISVDELRQRIPVTDYEFFRSSIDQMKTGDHQALLGSGNRLLMYAVTSGTTADSKLIPVTERFVEDYRRGWQHWGVGAFRKHQQLSLLRMVQLASSHNRWTTDDGIPCGNISGLAAAMQKKGSPEALYDSTGTRVCQRSRSQATGYGDFRTQRPVCRHADHSESQHTAGASDRRRRCHGPSR